MKIIFEIKDKKQLDAVYFAYENPIRILNLIGQDKTNWDEVSIDFLEVTVRSRNCLRSANITTIGQLLKMTYGEILCIVNMGRKSADEIREVLKNSGLFLKDKK